MASDHWHEWWPVPEWSHEPNENTAVMSGMFVFCFKKIIFYLRIYCFLFKKSVFCLIRQYYIITLYYVFLESFNMHINVIYSFSYSLWCSFEAMFVATDTKNLCCFLCRLFQISCNKYRLDTLFIFMLMCICKRKMQK